MEFHKIMEFVVDQIDETRTESKQRQSQTQNKVITKAVTRQVGNRQRQQQENTPRSKAGKSDIELKTMWHMWNSHFSFVTDAGEWDGGVTVWQVSCDTKAFS